MTPLRILLLDRRIVYIYIYIYSTCVRRFWLSHVLLLLFYVIFFFCLSFLFSFARFVFSFIFCRLMRSWLSCLSLSLSAQSTQNVVLYTHTTTTTTTRNNIIRAQISSLFASVQSRLVYSLSVCLMMVYRWLLLFSPLILTLFFTLLYKEDRLARERERENDVYVPRTLIYYSAQRITLCVHLRFLCLTRNEKMMNRSSSAEQQQQQQHTLG